MKRCPGPPGSVLAARAPDVAAASPRTGTARDAPKESAGESGASRRGRKALRKRSSAGSWRKFLEVKSLKTRNINEQYASLTFIHPPTHTIFRLHLPTLDQIQNRFQVKNKIPWLGPNKPNDFDADCRGSSQSLLSHRPRGQLPTRPQRALWVAHMQFLTHREVLKPLPSLFLQQASRVSHAQAVLSTAAPAWRPQPAAAHGTGDTAAGRRSLSPGRRARSRLWPFVVTIFVTKHRRGCPPHPSGPKH